MFFSPKHLASAGFLMLIGFQPMSALSAVINASESGFSIRSTLEISAPPQRVYDAIVTGVGSWWDPSHTYSGTARNLAIDATPGGCFCERWGTAGVWHMTVVNVDPGKRLRLSGGLGPLQDMGVAGSLTFSLVADGGKTKLDLTYNVGGYSPDGFNKLALTVDSVLLEQITRLKRYVESGNPNTK